MCTLNYSSNVSDFGLLFKFNFMSSGKNIHL